jgi:hypothetical protein
MTEPIGKSTGLSYNIHSLSYNMGCMVYSSVRLYDLQKSLHHPTLSVLTSLSRTCSL